MSSPGNSSVYVGDLAEGATEHHLHQVFSQAGEIHSVRRCRQTGRESLSYGYVNYVWPEDAQRAIQTLNHVSICGRRVRLMWSQRDGSARKSGVGNVFVKNLHPDLVDIKVLHDHFEPYGKILSTKVATDRDGVSRKYGFVQFEDPDAATRAIEALDKTDLCGQTLEVAPFIPAKDRASEPGKFCNVYVKNLGNQVDSETLKSAFVQFGPVSSAVVMRNNRGHSRGFGFVNFENPEDAARAVAGMDNYAFEGQTWKVDRAQRRESTGDKDTSRQHLRRSLHVRNLPLRYSEQELRMVFEEYGDVESIKFASGDRSSAYVQFWNAEDAEAAIISLQGRKLGNQTEPLLVALQPRREGQGGGRRETQARQQPFASAGANRRPVSYIQPVQPLLPAGFQYFSQGTTYIYGQPTFAVPQGQQQLPSGYLPPQAQSHSLPPMYDQMAGMLSGSAYHQAPGGMTTITPMVRVDSSQPGAFFPYEGHTAVPQIPWREQEAVYQARGRRTRSRQVPLRQPHAMQSPYQSPAAQPPLSQSTSEGVSASGSFASQQGLRARPERDIPSRLQGPSHQDISQQILETTRQMLSAQESGNLMSAGSRASLATEGLASLSLLPTDPGRKAGPM